MAQGINVDKLKQVQKLEAKENAHAEPTVKQEITPTVTLPEEKAEPQVEKKSATATQKQPEPKAEVKIEPEIQKPEVKAPEVKPDTKKEESELNLLLKKYGISSQDELEKRLNKKEEEPTIQKTADQLEAEAIDYAVKNGKLKLDDYTGAKEKAKKSDEELHFTDFAEKLKSKNRNITPEAIQEKYNRKYGEEIVEENGIKVIYDDDTIKDEAKSIREKLLNPIMNVKNEYETFDKSNQLQKSIDKDYNRIKNQIPSTIEIPLDEEGKEKFDYHIDEKLQPELEKEFEQNYKAYRNHLVRNNITTDENFNVKSFYTDFVKGKMLRNIMKTYASEHGNQRVQEELKPFENKLTTPLETDSTPIKKEYNLQAELDYIKKKKRGY